MQTASKYQVALGLTTPYLIFQLLIAIEINPSAGLPMMAAAGLGGFAGWKLGGVGFEHVARRCFPE